VGLDTFVVQERFPPLQGAPAENSEFIAIESFNVILKRDVVDTFIKNATTSVRNRFTIFAGVAAVKSNQELVAIEFINSERLDAFVKQLIAFGFRMTKDGAFWDFAIAHADPDVALKCEWLEFSRLSGPTQVRLKGEEVSDQLASAESFQSGFNGWLTEMGHGFIISREDEYDVWLDFSSGNTIICLKDPHIS
jgi:hypothetical protein